MSQVVFQNVIRRFLTVYGAPNTHDEAAYFDEYIRALSKVSESLLKSAVDEIIDNRTFSSWPTVGEIRNTVNSVAARNYRPHIDKFEYYEKPDEESCQRVSEIAALLTEALKQPTSSAKTIDTSRKAFEDRYNAGLSRFRGSAA
jgi:hypothetical protein